MPPWATSLKHMIVSILRHVPLIRAFTYADKKAHNSSCREFFLILGVSLLPLVGCVLIDMITGFSVKAGRIPGDASWYLALWIRLYDNIQAGEIFIYVCAVVGPVVLVMANYNDESKQFPEFLTFILTLGALIFLSVLIFSLHRSGKIENRLITDFGALTLYTLSLLLWYCALLYERVRPDINMAKATQSDANQLREAFEKGDK